MRNHFPHSSFMHAGTGKDGTQVSLRHGAEGPATSSFALTSMSDPQGFDDGRNTPRGVIPSPALSWQDRDRRPRAVILDRDPGILEVLGEVLRDEDFEVTLATQWPDEDDLTRLDPDVIIADAALDHRVNGHSEYTEPPTGADGIPRPVIYSTVEPDVAARLADREMPVLLKPFDLDTLLALLGRDET